MSDIMRYFGDNFIRPTPSTLREQCLHCPRPVFRGELACLSKLHKEGAIIPGLAHYECHKAYEHRVVNNHGETSISLTD